MLNYVQHILHRCNQAQPSPKDIADSKLHRSYDCGFFPHRLSLYKLWPIKFLVFSIVLDLPNYILEFLCKCIISFFINISSVKQIVWSGSMQTTTSSSNNKYFWYVRNNHRHKMEPQDPFYQNGLTEIWKWLSYCSHYFINLRLPKLPLKLAWISNYIQCFTWMPLFIHALLHKLLY